MAGISGSECIIQACCADTTHADQQMLEVLLAECTALQAGPHPSEAEQSELTSEVLQPDSSKLRRVQQAVKPLGTLKQRHRANSQLQHLFTAAAALAALTGLPPALCVPAARTLPSTQHTPAWWQLCASAALHTVRRIGCTAVQVEGQLMEPGATDPDETAPVEQELPQGRIAGSAPRVLLPLHL